MNQFHDPNDWGFQKRHVYDWEMMNDNMIELNTCKNTKHQLKSTINYHYTYSKGKPFGTGENRRVINTFEDIEELDSYSPHYSEYVNQWNNTGKITIHKTRWLCLERHLQAAQQGHKNNYLFYTTSPNKQFNIICLDVDDIYSDEDYYSVAHYLSSLFPNSYYEKSTNGTGLHFYIIIRFNFERHFFSDINEGIFRNILYYLLSQALGSIVNDNFNVKFDAVKGTNPLYDNKNGFLKYGTLVKLPAPVTYEQFHTLYSASVYSEEYLLCMINYLNDLTCSYSCGIYTINSIMSSLSSVLKEVPVRTPCKDLVAKMNKQNNSVSYTSSLLSSTKTSGGRNAHTPDYKGKNDDYKKYTIQDIMNIGDSRSRESLYIKRYVGDHYSKHGTMPPEDDVEQHYRIEMNYNKIGDFRKKRFHNNYQHTVDTFDPDKVSHGSVPYKIGMYSQAFTQADIEITAWINENKAYKYNIYRYDVDITLEYIYLCCQNKKSRKRERLIKKYAKQKEITEEQAEETLQNTVPRQGLISFYQYIIKKHKTVMVDGKMKKINRCDRKKATALLDLVIELGLAECIDSTFDTLLARKFELSEAVKQIRESWNTKDDKVGTVLVA